MGRILALDYGQTWIGVAISDESKMIAQVLEPAVPRDGKELIKLGALIKKYGIIRVVVGLPVNLTGDRHKSAASVQEFIQKLRNKIKIPIEETDERFTTAAAAKILKEQNFSFKKNKTLIDNTSAWVLLQNYLDSSHENRNK